MCTRFALSWNQSCLVTMIMKFQSVQSTNTFIESPCIVQTVTKQRLDIMFQIGRKKNLRKENNKISVPFRFKLVDGTSRLKKGRNLETKTHDQQIFQN